MNFISFNWIKQQNWNPDWLINSSHVCCGLNQLTEVCFHCWIHCFLAPKHPQWISNQTSELMARNQTSYCRFSCIPFKFNLISKNINHIDHECSMQPYCYNINSAPASSIQSTNLYFINQIQLQFISGNEFQFNLLNEIDSD